MAYDRCIHNPASLSPTPMPHNLQTAPGDTFALPSWQVLSLSGRDALAFAQAQFMNDRDVFDVEFLKHNLNLSLIAILGMG